MKSILATVAILLFSTQSFALWEAMDLRYMSAYVCPQGQECRYVDTAAPNTYDWASGVMFVDADDDGVMHSFYIDTQLAVNKDAPINLGGRFYAIGSANEQRVVYTEDYEYNPWSFHFDQIAKDTLKFLVVNPETGYAVRYIFDMQE